MAGFRLVVVGLFLLAACGRIGFEAETEDARDARADDASSDAVAPTDYSLRCPMDNDPGAGGPDCIGAGVQMCSACPTPSGGMFGGAYSFNTTQRFDLGPSTLIGNVYTISIWIRTGPTTTSVLAFFSQPATATNIYNVVNLFVTADGNVLFETSPTGSSYEFTQTTGLNVRGAWHHVAATWDGATKRLYVDGVLGAEMSTVAISGGELLSIGADLDTGTPTLYFDGELDELRIYPRVLTTAEIATLAR